MTRDKMSSLILLTFSVSLILMVPYDSMSSWGQCIFIPIGLVSSLATLILFIFCLKARNP